MRRRKLVFVGHLYWMKKTRLAKQIFDYMDNYGVEVRKDLERSNIPDAQMLDREQNTKFERVSSRDNYKALKSLDGLTKTAAHRTYEWVLEKEKAPDK